MPPHLGGVICVAINVTLLASSAAAKPPRRHPIGSVARAPKREPPTARRGQHHGKGRLCSLTPLGWAMRRGEPGDGGYSGTRSTHGTQGRSATKARSVPSHHAPPQPGGAVGSGVLSEAPGRLVWIVSSIITRPLSNACRRGSAAGRVAEAAHPAATPKRNSAVAMGAGLTTHSGSAAPCACGQRHARGRADRSSSRLRRQLDASARTVRAFIRRRARCLSCGESCKHRASQRACAAMGSGCARLRRRLHLGHGEQHEIERE